MENRILNQYGAADHKSPIIDKADRALETFELAMRELIQEHDLTGIEIRCLAACMEPSVFAEETLLYGIKARKQERDTQRKEIYGPKPTTEPQLSESHPS